MAQDYHCAVFCDKRVILSGHLFLLQKAGSSIAITSFPTRTGSCVVWRQRTKSLSSAIQEQWLPIQRVNFFPWQATDLQFSVWEIPAFGEEIQGGTSFAVTDSWVTVGRHLCLHRATPFKRNCALPLAKSLKNCLCHHVYLFANRRAARAAVISLSRISLDTI